MIRLTTFVPLQKILSTFLNNLQDRTANADWLAGLKIWAPQVDCTDGATLVVRAIHSLTDGSTVPVNGNTATGNVTVGSLLPVAGSFAASTRYHLYAYVSGTGPNLLFEIRSDATYPPDASRTIKNTDATRIWLCSFVTDGAGAIRKFYKTGNRVTYIEPIDLGTLTASTWDVVSLAGYLPSWARTVYLRVYFVTDPGGFANVQVRMYNQSASARRIAEAGTVGAAGLAQSVGVMAMPINSASSFSTAFEYQVSVAGSSAHFYLDGYED